MLYSLNGVDNIIVIQLRSIYENKDMSEEELQEKLGEIQEEQAPPEPQQPQPQQPTFEGLRRLGTIT